ncbi:MAG: hypothetical protein ACQEWG_16330 [Bacteroidota bacterium]
MRNFIYLIAIFMLAGCNSDKKETVASMESASDKFKFELNDTLYLGENVGEISDYKTKHKDIDYLLSVIIENQYEDGIAVKDTFSDGTLSPWFGVYANKKGKMIVKGTILEEALNDRTTDKDSILKIERTFFHFSKEVYVLDSIHKKG